MSIATYSFLPYLRQGLSNNLQSAGGARGTFTVKLDIHGDATVTPANDKSVEIYGPGDIIGIDVRSVVKTDPHNRITNFESNYLVYIDFYDEDFPWRYTPAVPGAARLNPWITLVVLADGEFTEGQSNATRPLPFITLKGADIKTNFFPKEDQLWAWAHVHFNGDLTASDSTIITENPADVNASLDKLQSALNSNPDFAYSRLVCARKLKPSTAYHAFVIPSYESGRRAGAGKPAAEINAAALEIAWHGADLEFPYYYRWDFNTGTMGDFEYLVRLLKPKVADSRVGRRVMDMTNPEGSLTWAEDPDNVLGGILRLGGALKVPKESLTDEEIARTEKFDQWAIKKYPVLHPFQLQVAGLLNLADDYNIFSSKLANQNAADNSDLAIDPNIDADPLITPPIYGKWHAMVERVYQDRDGNRIDNNYNWLNELNLDPRFRVPAHFGTLIVQDNQEDYMQAAWEQIGEVLAANRQIRFGQFAIAAGLSLYAKHFESANAVTSVKTMMLTAPLQKRIMYNGQTVFQNVRQSVLPGVLLSAPMRRIARPRGRMMTQLQKFSATPATTVRLETLVTKINSGELLPSPPKVMPPALPTVDGVANELQPLNIPPFLADLLKQYPWLPYVPLALAVLLVLILLIAGAAAVAWVIGVAIAGALVYLWRQLTNWQQDLQTAGILTADKQTPQSVDSFPKSSNFHLAAPAENFTPGIGATADNDNALRFKNSVKDMYLLHEIVKAAIPVEPKREALLMNVVSENILQQIKPDKTVPAWTWQQVFFPGWIKNQLVDEGFVEAMAYPKINKPMYADLKKRSDELFLPNVNLIEHNSITLLETNQPFIESYMVGLNHEFARELLWREYPTDQRGSYFRQFWDASAMLKDPSLTGKPDEEQREPYYDITKLHEWRRKSKLGDHDNRQKPGEPPKEEVVLVIRGELLKKYPTAVVYAHHADWSKNQNNVVDVHEPRSLAHADEGDKPKPDPKYVRTPLYSAKIDPDIYFFGFDLTVKEAQGESQPGTPNFDNAGWFFVIKERPGEPRFGLDITATDDSSQELVTWNDLDWAKVVKAEEGVIDVLHLPQPLKLPNALPGSVDTNTTEGKGRKEQYDDDKNVPAWDTTIDAAKLAYILYQVPMMVCVHAAEMLLKKK
jgi:hypothetical protein